ncbi:hypothetical protein [Streptomyces sp. NPDC051219]|uniref:hypothetical protein n=1 Tax=Streptomyces sp. NPDC051219 TaxID=3155283 RepID=UPI00341BABAA
MSGPLWLTPGDRADTLPLIPRQRPGRAAADPLEELAERLDDMIAAAVHPDEIAAILESDGMTDDHIRLSYGREDSFALAEELYARVPRRFPEPPGPVVDPWNASLLGCLLRGLVFALPGLAYVLGAPLLSGPPDRLGLPAGTVTLLAGALVGWVWNQSLSHRAYSWLGLGDREAAGRALLAGAPAGALLGAAVSFSVSGPDSAAAFASGQSLYLGAATVLLVLGRERALLYALLPMAAGAALTTVLTLPSAARIALLVTSLLAAVALAARELPLPGGPGLRAAVLFLSALRRRRFATAVSHLYSREAAVPQLGPHCRQADAGPREPRVPRWALPPDATARRAAGLEAWARLRWRLLADGVAGLRASGRSGAGRGGREGTASRVRPAPRLAASLPYGLFGLGTGVLVLHAALGEVLASGPGAAVAAPSAVALTLSMGPAEWLLHRFRSDSLAGLRASTTPGAFWRATAGTLAECLTGYLLVLLALGVVGTALWPDAPGLGGVRLATLLLLGAVLWTGLLLQSFGAVLAAASVCGAAALAQTVALLMEADNPQRVQLVVAGTAAAVLAALVCVLLGRATAHR